MNFLISYLLFLLFAFFVAYLFYVKGIANKQNEQKLILFVLNLVKTVIFTKMTLDLSSESFDFQMVGISMESSSENLFNWVS